MAAPAGAHDFDSVVARKVGRPADPSRSPSRATPGQERVFVRARLSIHAPQHRAVSEAGTASRIMKIAALIGCFESQIQMPPSK